MKKNKIILIIIIAVLLRIFLMLFTYHPDLSGQSLVGYFFGTKNVFNIYDYLINLPKTHPLVKNFGVNDIFIYPPLTYFTLGFFQKLLSIFNIKSYIELIMNGVNIYTIKNISLFLFLIKLPYLVIDLLAAKYLSLIFDDKKKQQLVYILWLFNPVTLYATFCMGVFDIIPVFFTILSIYFLKKNKYLSSALMLGFGAAFKTYPIFFLPFIIFAAAKTFWPRTKIAIIGLLPIILTNLPFITSSAYRYMVFSPKSQKMLFMEWMITGAEGLFPFLIAYTIIVLFTHNIKKANIDLYKYYLVFFFLLFSVTHYHPQWFLWITPFILLHLVDTNLKYLWHYLVMFFIYVFIVLCFENSLSVGLFAILNPSLNNFPGIGTFIASKTNISILKSQFRSIFAGIAIFLTYEISKTQKTN